MIVDALWPALTPLIRRMDGEAAHDLALSGLRARLAGRRPTPAPDALKGRLGRLALDNPIGLAAGFDKQATAPRAVFRLGVGFAELGGVTPLPQPGNPRPRVFRSFADRAVVNRYGLNSDGMDAVARRLERIARPLPGPIGVNLGRNKETEDPEGDYRRLTETLAPLVDFVTVNVSSPNTAGLRDLQGADALRRLLAGVREARDRVAPSCAVWVKVAPDLSEADRTAIAAVALDVAVDAVVVSNTTVARPDGLDPALAQETGGLSGRPLLPMALAGVRSFRRSLGPEMPIVGCGGIATAADILGMLRAGATAVQLYSALVFDGPGLVWRLRRDLAALLAGQGCADLAEAVAAGGVPAAEATELAEGRA